MTVIEKKGRLENLKELITGLAEFESLDGFLEHVSLVMEQLESGGGDQVSIMTLHAAKGLEFDTVFLPGWEVTGGAKVGMSKSSFWLTGPGTMSTVRV